ncbi:MAG: putative amidohydrolase [Candidatus Azotimanducaceae bacterium]|jgi:predicted amidohydrolase
MALNPFSGLVSVGVVQMVSSQFFEKNLIAADSFIREAAGNNVKAVFLPENFLLFANPNPREFAEAEQVNAKIFLSNLAAELKCWIFAGTLPMSYTSGGKSVLEPRVRAASLVFNDEGLEVARYDKIHMFDVDVADKQKRYRESDIFEAGDSLETVQTPFGRFGLTVCYDIRFPEVYQRLRDKDVQCFAIPSAFTKITGEAHFEVLMRARAVENFCFTIAACQGGTHDSGRETYGNSMVVNPWGETLCRASKGESIIYANLDYQMLEDARRNMPTHLQRKIGFDEN